MVCEQSTIEQKKEARGFILLFAVLISSIVLSVGLGVFNLSFKEVLLSIAGRESQRAFFIADTGSECAFYWDRKYEDSPNNDNSAFVSLPPSPALAPNHIAIPTTAPTGITCNEVDIAATGRQDGTGGAWEVQQVSSGTDNGMRTRFILNQERGCARVSVEKYIRTDGVLGEVLTSKVTSDGFTICPQGVAQTIDQRAIQRTVETCVVSNPNSTLSCP